MNVSLAVKAGLGFIARACDLLDAVSGSPGKSIVLGYHRVLPSDSVQVAFCAPGMYVTPETLRRHLVFLKQHYRLVHVTDLLVNRCADKCCAITFDDGWWDNYAYAYPILKELDVPATIFLATGFIESRQWPWPDRLAFYRQFSDDLHCQDQFCELLAVSGCAVPCGSSNSLAVLIGEMKKCSHPDIVHAMELIDDRFSELYAVLHGMNPAVTWCQIREMKAAGVEFGLHSHAHIIANHATEDSLLEHDYRVSAERFRSELGVSPLFFAYPNGNYTSAAIRTLQKLGIEAAVTTQAGFVDGSDPMILQRILIHEDVSSSENLLTFRLISSLVVP